MTYEASNLTNEEYYNLNGCLRSDRIEDLLDKEAELEKFNGIEVDKKKLLEVLLKKISLMKLSKI